MYFLVKRIFLITVIIFLASETADGKKSIRCYTCVSTNGDMTCVDDPDNVPVGSPITNCDKDCCTILRQEYIESPGSVRSFSRSCQDKCPKDGFSVTDDASFRTYQTYCTEPLCNKGKGDSDIDDRGHGDGGDGGVIDGIDGKDGSGVSSASVLLALLLPAFPLAFSLSLSWHH
ncbi:uncharacterized protein LOC135215390 [Macrobrachium nipponense]|uniref:uncharacterized protein LOC135215390 n=1 Tax=Macrobrachium nipponense TaxID=159736 RepID=UPI0030C7D414